MKQVVAFLLSFFILQTLSAQKLQPWKVQLETGQRYKISNVTANHINQQIMGQEIQINISAVINDSMYVKSETKGSFNLSKITTRIIMDMDAMGQQTNIDSDKKEDMESEAGQKLKDKIGVTVDAMITEKGVVQITSEIKNDDTQAMGGLMSLNSDSASIAGFFLAPPSKELKTGETWADSLITPQSKTTTIYTFLKSEKGIAYLNFELKGNVEGTTSTNGMEIKSIVSTTGNGTLQVELKSGLVLERKTDMKLTGTNEVMGMQIPLTGETKSIVTITKL